jgi:hypothetical protein
VTTLSVAQLEPPAAMVAMAALVAWVVMLA